MEQLRVKVVIETEQLAWWSVRHRELGNESVARALALAADHYAGIDDDDARSEPPAPVYPAGLDVRELRQWADWHADRSPVGVAQILYEAAAAADACLLTARQGTRGQGGRKQG